MPNICENFLFVSGKGEEFEKEFHEFREKIRDKKGEIFFEKLYPAPRTAEAIKDLVEWQRENWGTKGIIDVEAKAEDKEFIIDSAWTPPIELFRHISKMFPSMFFLLDYIECGMEFCGYAHIYNGRAMVADLPWHSEQGRHFRATRYFSSEQERYEQEEGYKEGGN